MIEIILTRHGNTQWNQAEIFRGRADIPLTGTGVRQVEALGKYLQNENIDVIYTSPLKRAVKTADAIAKHQKLDVNAVENLNDLDFGEWTGKTTKEVAELYPELYQDWLDTPEQVRAPGGESLETVRQRAMPFIQDAAARCGEGKIVIVSHRVVLKVVICALLGLDNSRFWNIRVDTAALTRFQCDGRRNILVSHNETSYLKKITGKKLADF